MTTTPAAADPLQARLDAALKAQEAAAEKVRQIKAQQKAREARERAQLLKTERQNDTRRKVLLGAYLVNKMVADEATRQKVLAGLDSFLTRPADRQLFDLPVTPAPAAAA